MASITSSQFCTSNLVSPTSKKAHQVAVSWTFWELEGIIPSSLHTSSRLPLQSADFSKLYVVMPMKAVSVSCISRYSHIGFVQPLRIRWLIRLPEFLAASGARRPWASVKSSCHTRFRSFRHNLNTALSQILHYNFLVLLTVTPGSSLYV